MTDKEIKTYARTHCSHYVLGECSQEHHNNCVGTDQCIKDLEQQLQRLQAENEELKKANIHIDTNRKCKADKLKRIEELIINCQSGYTDEFIQSILAIVLENEPSVTDLSIIDCYKQALEEIETYCTDQLNEHFNHCKYAKGCVNACGISKEVLLKAIIDKIKEVMND